MNPVAAPPGPVRVSVAHECDLVTRGLRDLLGPYRSRVLLLDPQRGGEPSPDADLTLFDPAGGPHLVRGAGMLPRGRGSGRLVAYTWNPRPDLVAQALAAGFAGVVSKTVSAPDLVAALEAAHRGEQVVEYGISAPRRTGAEGEHLLTPREEEVVRLIAVGLDNVSIAREVSLSINSVKSHIRSAYRKMGVASRSQAVLWGVRHGFLEPAPESPALTG